MGNQARATLVAMFVLAGAAGGEVLAQALPPARVADRAATTGIESILPLRLSLAMADPPEQPGTPQAPAGAQTAPYGAGDSRVGRASLKAGLGFTASPADFLLSFEADYFLTNAFSLGPLLQFGVDDDPFIFAPTLNFRYTLDVPDVGGLKPFAEAGVGLAHESKHHGGHTRTDTGFLFNLGGGAEFFLTDKLAVGSEILFNILPDEVLDDHFFFSWQAVTFSIFF